MGNESDQNTSDEQTTNQDPPVTETGNVSGEQGSTEGNVETTGEEGVDASTESTPPAPPEETVTQEPAPAPPAPEPAPVPPVEPEVIIPPVPAPEPIAPPPLPPEEPAVVMAAPAPVVKQAPVVESAVESEDPQVASLKIQLDAFKVTAMKRGSEPTDHAACAKLIAQITRFVIQSPKTAVLNALLTFFEENLKGACLNKNYMKGSTTLSMNEEQQVGYLYGLFSDMAQKKIVRINSGQVIQILKKPEIVNFYERKMSVLKQAAQTATE